MKKILVLLNKRLLLPTLIICAFSFACQKTAKCDALPDIKTNFPALTKDKAIIVEIYLDSTLSMQGFTNTETFSYYQQIIPLLESAVIKNWKNSTIIFNKFGDANKSEDKKKSGDKVENLSGRKFLEANKSAFYSDASRKTLIENAIETANVDNLSIILTDLFQDNADINPLVEKIKDKFIINGKAVGIMAVKSQFKGFIYDVGSKNYKFQYPTSGDSALRPFYILAFGSHSDITAYFDTLENSGLKDFPEKNRIIFSPFLTNQPAAFSNSKIIDTKNVNDVSGVLVKSNGNVAAYKELKVVNGKKPATFTAQLPFEKLPNTIDFGTQLEPEIESWTCRKIENNESNQNNGLPFAANPNVKDALDISSSFVDANTIEFNLTIHTEKFDNNEVNCFRILLRPKEFALPEWTDGWNMTDEQIDEWYKNPTSFDGSKTYNLKRFIQDLWVTTGKSHSPKVADFYLYIKPD